MWDFSVFLFLALLYPGSLLLPGVYGFAVQLVVAVFGTVVGDWVDLNPRMKGECFVVSVIKMPYILYMVHGFRPESERASQEQQNGTNLSFVAPSSEEL